MDILFGINDYVIKLTFTKLKEVISTSKSTTGQVSGFRIVTILIAFSERSRKANFIISVRRFNHTVFIPTFLFHVRGESLALYTKSTV